LFAHEKPSVPTATTPAPKSCGHLRAQGYIDGKGRVQDTLKNALKEGTLSLPPGFEAQRAPISAMLRKAAGKLEIKNADDRRAVPVRRAVLDSAEFKALWDRIKQKTTYRVQFDNEKLITSCITSLNKAPPITRTRLHWRKAGLAIGKAGVEATELAGADTVNLTEADIELPDVLTELQDRSCQVRRPCGHNPGGARSSIATLDRDLIAMSPFAGTPPLITLRDGCAASQSITKLDQRSIELGDHTHRAAALARDMGPSALLRSADGVLTWNFS